MTRQEFNEIKLPDNLDGFIDKAVDKAVEEKKKMNIKKGAKAFGMTAAGAAIILTLGMMNPTMAAKMPLIGNVFEHIQNGIETPGDYSNYADEINESVYDNGINIKLSEVYCDGESLYVSYLVESEEPFKYRKYKYDSEIDSDITEEQAAAIEANQLLYGGEGKVDFIDKDLDNSGIAGLEGRYIDEYTFAGVEKYNLRSMVEDSEGKLTIPDKFEFSISIDNIRCPAYNEKDKDQIIKGEWNFKVNVSVDKNSAETIEVNSLNEQGIGVKELIITPFEVKVITEHPESDKVFEYNVRMKDETGKEIDMDLGKWNEDSSVTTFSKSEILGEKVTVYLYKDILREIDKDNYEDMGDEIIYTTEVNLK